MSDESKDLQARADRVGLKVDGRWGVDRLREEVEAAEAAAAAEVIELAEPDEPAPPAPEHQAIRAGGYVNWGYGDGWVLDNE